MHGVIEHSRVLVLNYSYEPLQVCNAQRAIRMMLLGKAETLEVDGMLIRSEYLQIRLPLVIRLLRYVRVARIGDVPFNKKNIFRRDNNTCQYCGEVGRDLTIDHVVPRSRGGSTGWENVVCCCRNCNARKGDRLPEEVDLRLISRPHKPRFLFSEIGHPRISEAAHFLWQKYLHSGKT